MRSMVVLACLFTIAFAGCADTEPTAEAGSEVDPKQQDGPVDAGNAEASASATAVPPAAPVEVAFSWSGNVGDWVYGCAVVVCAGSFGPSDNLREERGLHSVDLTLRWDGVPGQELGFGIATGCDGGCDFVKYAYGTSPLTLQADELDPTEEHEIVVWHPYRGAGPAGAQVGTQTDFSVEGTVLQAA